MESQKTQIARAILRKNKAGGIPLPNFKLYYKAIILITYNFSIKNKRVYQWKRIESPEISPTAAECIFFSIIHRTFSSIHHTLGHKTGPNKF